MRQILSILDPKNTEFEEEVLKAIAKKHSLNDNFVMKGMRLIKQSNQALIVKTVKEVAPITIILITGMWGIAYFIVPEIFQDQSDNLIKVLGYLLLIPGSLVLAWFIFEARVPRVNRGSIEEEVEFSEQTLKPMIDAFLSDS